MIRSACTAMYRAVFWLGCLQFGQLLYRLVGRFSTAERANCLRLVLVLAPRDAKNEKTKRHLVNKNAIALLDARSSLRRDPFARTRISMWFMVALLCSCSSYLCIR